MKYLILSRTHEYIYVCANKCCLNVYIDRKFVQTKPRVIDLWRNETNVEYNHIVVEKWRGFKKKNYVGLELNWRNCHFVFLMEKTQQTHVLKAKFI